MGYIGHDLPSNSIVSAALIIFALLGAPLAVAVPFLYKMWSHMFYLTSFCPFFLVLAQIVLPLDENMEISRINLLVCHIGFGNFSLH